MARLNLPTVTLCAAASVNVAATVLALRQCMRDIEFAECLLFTDAPLKPPEPSIRVVPIARLESAQAYSEFMLGDLADHIRTDYVLIVQWDGFVVDSKRWESAFLDHDYVGAPWPQFRDGWDVGNGGFSLRSRRLLEACRDPRFIGGHPEDVAICRTNREFLESVHHIRFASRVIAERFSLERSLPSRPSFGFHGVFNIAPLFGADRLWEIYRMLDDRRGATVDFWRLVAQLGEGRASLRRRLRLSTDRVAALFNGT